MSDKKPDNFVDNPGLLPYGSNIGAPAIQVSNIENWKEPRRNSCYLKYAVLI